MLAASLAELTLDLPVWGEVREARKRVAPVIHHAPAIHSHTFGERIGANAHPNPEMFRLMSIARTLGAPAVAVADSLRDSFSPYHRVVRILGGGNRAAGEICRGAA